MSMFNSGSRNGEETNTESLACKVFDGKTNPASIFAANLIFFIVIVLYLAFQFIIRAFVNYYGISKILDNSYAILLIMEYGFILLPVLLYVFIKQKDIKSFFKIKKVPFLDLILIVFMMIALSFTGIFFNSFIIYIISHLGKVPYNAVPVANSLPEYLLGIFVIAVTPAICEEALHRGLLLNAYFNKGYVKAIILTSLYFGIFHFDLNNLMGPFILGLFIGYIVYKTGSIIAGVVAHFINNFYSITIQYVFRKDFIIPKYISVTGVELFASFVAACFMFSVVFLPLFFWFRHRNKNNTVCSNNISNQNDVDLLLNNDNNDNDEIDVNIDSISNYDNYEINRDYDKNNYGFDFKEFLKKIDFKALILNYWPILATVLFYLVYNIVYLYAISVGTQ